MESVTVRFDRYWLCIPDLLKPEAQECKVMTTKTKIKQDFLDLVDASFRTRWFARFKREHSADLRNPPKAEDVTWAAALYVGRRIGRLLNRPITLMERAQILDQCLGALEVTGRLQVFSTFMSDCGGMYE
jgi:hypothetical protein